jgi:hypothetical protein
VVLISHKCEPSNVDVLCGPAESDDVLIVGMTVCYVHTLVSHFKSFPGEYMLCMCSLNLPHQEVPQLASAATAVSPGSLLAASIRTVDVDEPERNPVVSRQRVFRPQS